MPSPNDPVPIRTRVCDRYALMPLDGFPPSRLPRWRSTESRILASPALGADFVQMHLNVRPGGGVNQPEDDRTQTFFYALTGGAELTLGDHRVTLGPGGFAFIPHGENYDLRVPVATTLLLLRKLYEGASGVTKPEPLTGNASNVPAEPWMGNPHARLQMLLPDEMPWDFAMNILTFDPGHGLPNIETHVMEHGLYFIEGQGTYYLGNEWIDVKATDYIWMGAFCPQSFVATGQKPARYLYYKNVNRDIRL